MKAQDLFLVCLIIVNSLSIYCSDFENAKIKRRTVSFDAGAKSYDGRKAKDADVKDNKEERPETDGNDQSGESMAEPGIQHDYPFSLAQTKSDDQSSYEEQKAAERVNIHEHYPQSKISAVNEWEDIRRNEQDCKFFDIQRQEQAQEKCKMLLHYLHIKE